MVDSKAWDHTALIVSTIANANRDKKKHPKPFRAAQFHPYLRKKVARANAYTAAAVTSEADRLLAKQKAKEKASGARPQAAGEGEKGGGRADS